MAENKRSETDLNSQFEQRRSSDMTLKQQIDAFVKFSGVPMHINQNGADLVFLSQNRVLESYPPIEQALLWDGRQAVYTISPEHIAFALIRIAEGYIFFGPAPAVEVAGEIVEEALNYAGRPLEKRAEFISTLRKIPNRDILRFRDLAAYFALTAFDARVSEWRFADYPPPVKSAGHVDIVKPQSPEFDDFSALSTEFGQKVMNAVMHGKIDELEKELSSMGSVFLPSIIDMPTNAQLHDKFVIALAYASIAAHSGGLSGAVIDALSSHYLSLASKTGTFRETVRLLKLMLNDFAARTHQAQMITSDDPITQRACRDIENHLHEPLSASDIASRLGVSVQYLCQSFKQGSGKTLTNYIKERKIEEAKYLLNQQNADITEIATRLGFSSPNYFATVFKQITGTTPNSRRNKQTLFVNAGENDE